MLLSTKRLTDPFTLSSGAEGQSHLHAYPV